jgi:hypothetical protein
MKKIELIENCFGPDVRIDDESLFVHEYDNRNPQLISNLKTQVFDKLKDIEDKMDMNDWAKLIEIIVDRSDDYDHDEENSLPFESCEQCGNWNHTYIYLKKENDTES